MVGTPEWYAWLNAVSTFAFRSEYGSFTARKDPTLIISAIAQTLGLRESGDRLLLELLKEFLHSKQLLLVLAHCRDALCN